MPFKDSKKRNEYMREYIKKWRMANSEKYLAYHRKSAKKSYAKNKETLDARCREYYYKNKDKWKIYNKRRKEKNPELVREQVRQFSRLHYKANKQKYKDKQKKRYADYPEVMRTYTSNYRARKRKNGGSFTPYDLLNLYSKQKGLCYWCHTNLKKYEVDHVLPVSNGGTNDIYNLVLACVTCNRSKGAKSVMEFAGMLL